MSPSNRLYTAKKEVERVVKFTTFSELKECLFIIEELRSIINHEIRSISNPGHNKTLVYHSYKNLYHIDPFCDDLSGEYDIRTNIVSNCSTTSSDTKEWCGKCSKIMRF